MTVVPFVRLVSRFVRLVMFVTLVFVIVRVTTASVMHILELVSGAKVVP